MKTHAKPTNWLFAIALCASTAASAELHAQASAIPAGVATYTIQAENLDGVLLISARLRGMSGADTVGPLVLDTGAGYLALDRDLALRLGIADSASAVLTPTARPLPAIEFGGREIDQLSPVFTIDGEIVRRVTDRPVLGLIGHSLLDHHALIVDYPTSRVTLVHMGDDGSSPVNVDTPPERIDPRAPGTGPPDDLRRREAASREALAAHLAAGARAVPFRLAGDGKILVSARVADPDTRHMSTPLTLILDTGASKTALFEEPLAAGAPGYRRWPAARGILAPTLMGDAVATLVRIPRMELTGGAEPLRLDGADAAVLRSELGELLSEGIGETVHGLLGYSFLKHYGLAIDYAHRLAWFTPAPPDWDGRALEYTHVGIQIERHDGAVQVVAVVEGSPAARAGIGAGDELVAIDGERVTGLDIAVLSRRLEGEAGSKVELTLRRAGAERTHRIARRRLL